MGKSRGGWNTKISGCRKCSNDHTFALSLGYAHDAPEGRELLRELGPDAGKPTTVRFVVFRSHWQYEAGFCTPGEGHEKGGEGEVGYFRSNHWVPVPEAQAFSVGLRSGE